MKKSALLISIMMCSLLFAGLTVAQQQEEKDFLHASKVMNKSVVNDQDQELGSIKELIFSKEGELSFIAISREDGELTLVPFAAIRDRFQIRENDILVSGLSEEQITDAPRFSEDEIAQLEEGGEEEERVRGYFEQSGLPVPLEQGGPHTTQQ
jgi:hypothetical protein